MFPYHVTPLLQSNRLHNIHRKKALMHMFGWSRNGSSVTFTRGMTGTHGRHRMPLTAATYRVSSPNELTRMRMTCFLMTVLASDDELSRVVRTLCCQHICSYLLGREAKHGWQIWCQRPTHKKTLSHSHIAHTKKKMPSRSDSSVSLRCNRCEIKQTDGKLNIYPSAILPWEVKETNPSHQM